MAVMLVRALGLGELAKADADAALPFTDVTAQRGYIAIAYEIGMTTGTTETTFEPDGTAARPTTPLSSVTSTSTVGLPRESRISRPTTSTIELMFFPSFSAEMPKTN